MTPTGDIACAEKLLQPARLVLKTGRHIRLDPIERRVALWNEVRSAHDRFMREECGVFFTEVDLHMRSQFDAALVALAAAFVENGEEFAALALYTPEEIAIWQQIERFNTLEILSQDDIRNRIIRKDADLLGLFKEYYLTMNRYVSDTLENPGIRLPLRYYLRRRWNGYRGKMDAAIADAVTKFDWMQELVAEWEKDKNGPGRSGNPQ
jgi:hypothetical protein